MKMGMTDEPHARAFTWNALVYLATKLRIENGLLPAELDDMPAYQLEQELLSDAETKEIFVGNEKSVKEFDCTETIEEVVEINEEMAEEFEDKPVENPEEITIIDTMKSMAYDDGQWYCSDFNCFERGFSNIAPNTFHCDEHKKGN